MNTTQELYHYGVPGMRWGRKKGKQDYDILSKPRNKTNNKINSTKTTKTKLSKGKKVAIGTTVAAATLASIGAMAAKDTIGRYGRALLIARAAAKNL